MNFKVGCWLFLFVFIVKFAIGQTSPGSVKGIVTFKADVAAFTQVTLKKGDEVVAAAFTDDFGYYSITNVEAGTYDLHVSYSGESAVINNVVIRSGQTTAQDVIIKEEGADATTIEEIVIRDKLIEQDQVIRRNDQSLSDIQKLGGRSPVDIVAMAGSGIYQADAGRGISVRGGRGDQLQYFVDGMRVTGNPSLPQLSIKNVAVITGGTPVWYGDVMSGVVEIESADPALKHQFGGEVLTSQFLDANGYNLLALTAGGPILKAKIPSSDTTQPPIEITRLGYFFAFEGEFEKDKSPAFDGVYVTKESELKRIEANPLRPTVSGGELSFLNETNFLRKDAFERVKQKPNNFARRYAFNLRMDYKFNMNTKLSFGANYRYAYFNDWGLSNSLFAPEAASNYFTQNARAFLRFSQIITIPKPQNSVLKSLYYQVQVDVTRLYTKTFNEDFKDDLFKYGHVGRFVLNHIPGQEMLPYRDVMGYELIQPGTPKHNPNYTSDAYWQTSSYADTSLIFDASTGHLPGYAAYNHAIMNYWRENPQPLRGYFGRGFFSRRQNLENITGNYGLLRYNGIPNGWGPQNNYSLFTMPGVVNTGYSKTRNDMIRITGYANIELGRRSKGENEAKDRVMSARDAGTHTLRVGFEFDQRVERFFSIGASGLWNLMRQRANLHIRDIDTSAKNPIYVEGEDGRRYFQDTVLLARRYKGTEQTNFDKQLRRKLGLAENSLTFINTDYYDPSFYSLDMFTADELLNNGSSYVNYLGFDYTGGIQGRASDESFFTDRNKRPMNAYRPTYIAGYIQDKFELENIYITLGVRVDRLDLNQPVLKDKYIMRDFWTAEEAANRGGFSLPSAVGKDWVPYLESKLVGDAIAGPANIKGYRDKDNWYDKNGSPVDPTLLQVNGRVIPYIRGKDSLTFAAFQDYEPQINVMPRVSFSFSINDQANFFAHYDILTQRPTGAEVFQMLNYLYIEQNATNAISNPALKPARTIDYEVGFMQALGKNQDLAITISGFYREMRDMIQFFRVQNAYPITYDTYNNLDFGTVKGLTFDIKTSSNRLVSFRAAYTLQFANGTGSDANTARGATQGLVGFSTIRNLYPFSFDQRHTFTGNIALQFDQYRPGPNIAGYYPFKNFLAAFTFRMGSGTPFSRNALPNQADIQGGVNPTTRIAGNPNGSRLPFNTNFDLRLERAFDIAIGGKTEGEGNNARKVGGRILGLRVYVTFLNVFNIKNTLGVYRFSGQPDNSGFLESARGQEVIAQQVDPQAYVDQFRIKENNPGNFNLPRRIRIGCIFSF